MPPRLFVALVVAGWLAAMGWLVAERWLPWWRAEAEPTFTVDLADEVAPQHATWIMVRDGRKVSAGETRLTPRKDGHFEIATRLREIDLRHGSVDVRAHSLAMTRVVRRDGSLVSVEATARMKVRFLGAETPVEAAATAHVAQGRLVGECVVNHGQSRQAIGPIPLPAKGAFAPLQPLTKYGDLRAGQSWRLSHLDVTRELLSAAVRLVVGQAMADSFPGQSPASLGPEPPPAEVLAQLQEGTEDIDLRGERTTCRVIVFRDDRTVVGRTWVAVADGRVMKVEALGFGEPIVLYRD